LCQLPRALQARCLVRYQRASFFEVSGKKKNGNADLSLAHLSPLLSPASFVVDGYIGLGVPIGEDVDKLDNIQDGFIHYQLIRFCQATRLQYINGHVQLANQNVLQSSTLTTRSPMRS
jgi:hypothetical protein